MSSLNSMKQKLRPLGFYDLNDDSLISAELSAYAVVLNEISATLAEIERECFVNTAESYGLGMLERMLGPEQTNKSIEERRNQLLYRSAITANDFTKSSLEKALLAAGLDGSIVEYPAQNSVHINCSGLTNGSLDKAAAQKMVEEFLPAHLECIFNFGTLQWDSIDALGNTFDAMDARGLTWDEIDNFD